MILPENRTGLVLFFLYSVWFLCISCWKDFHLALILFLNFEQRKIILSYSEAYFIVTLVSSKYQAEIQYWAIRDSVLSHFLKTEPRFSFHFWVVWWVGRWGLGAKWVCKRKKGPGSFWCEKNIRIEELLLCEIFTESCQRFGIEPQLYWWLKRIGLCHRSQDGVQGKGEHLGGVVWISS